MSDPDQYLAEHDDDLVILDEVYRAPELFHSLRGIIDRGRRSGRKAGRFLLLGSAGIDLLKQSGDPLAGRIACLELAPFDALEIPPAELDRLWVRGGFPSSFLADDDALSALLGLRDKEDVLGHPVAGRTWETMAIETLIAVAPEGTEASFYRSATGAEIDLVLMLPGRRLWAVEIKRGSAPKVEKGFHLACADLKPRKQFLVYPGSERFPVADKTTAIGLPALADELRSAA